MLNNAVKAQTENNKLYNRIRKYIPPIAWGVCVCKYLLNHNLMYHIKESELCHMATGVPLKGFGQKSYGVCQ